ncbi:unnamed protein product [Periconia digitata]|uniref:Uncharacterized protein n=1 Tax=Periconia digitata TaxID=1303443 RepID=A0A9W4U876_9PLEO|nr:unnamed protein product [Periconia digitata]
MKDRVYDWKKRILIPLWTIRFMWIIIVVVFFGISLEIFTCYFDNAICDDYNSALTLIKALLYSCLGVILLLDTTQVFMFALDKLAPLALLIMNALQTLFWGGILVVSIATSLQKKLEPSLLNDPDKSSGLAVKAGVLYGFEVACVALYLPMAIYACIAMHDQRQMRKRGKYSLAS